ncbi:homeobox protein Mix.2-like [Rhinoderma darwinii]|uniref:homeobox protein Mix.2-like n=1 Tax=Rhinoderma darwinii TaxID=43563 RepID=UPI003F677CB3
MMAGCDRAPGDRSPDMYWQPHNLPTGMPSVLTDKLNPGGHGATHWQECNKAENPLQKSCEDQESGTSQRRKRMIFSKAQLNTLELFFKTNQYPDIRHRGELSKCLFIPESRVQVWFQNRRAKARHENGNTKKKPVLIEYFPDDQTGNKPTQRRQNTLYQQKMVATAKWVKTLKDSKQNFFPHPQPPSMGYHPYYPPSPVQHISSKVYQHSSSGPNMGVYHQVLNNMAPEMAIHNESMELSRGSSQIPNVLDYNQLQQNKTMVSEMTVGGTRHLSSFNGLNHFSIPVPYQMSIPHRDFYNQGSSTSDTCPSVWSTD